VAWIVLFTGGGYLFGNLPLVRDHLGFVLVAGLGAALVGPLAGAGLWRIVVARFRKGPPPAQLESRQATRASSAGEAADAAKASDRP